ncbi:hypothetical protein BDF20DRAFT_910060 [Mycotypha africana]|uniref:uncharacterized protein n=1 Tax=Mycotypha africana TaxID=64632 RepID=UPI00230131A7|nr:uncharacterized protein BDF20DRAFT_910060 [Mycotypha africana]KAI8987437.1 hypothetical protein BDF20DRAFT_910060 [Mycotypha africana]
MPPASTLSFKDRVLNLIKTLHFVWFLGHVLTVLGTVFYAISFFSNNYLYRLAYLGTLLSYGVVNYKNHGKIQVHAAYIQKLLMDENAQYFFLAFFWFLTKPIAVTLIPYCTFSAFHALGYVRTNVIPNVFPPQSTTASTTATGSTTTAKPSWQITTQQKIKSLTDKYYTTAMRFVAQSEVTLIAVRLLVGVFRFQFLPFIIYAQFLRMRYHLSSHTQQTFSQLRVRLDEMILTNNAPAMVQKIYKTIKAIIIRFGNNIVQQQARPAAAH